jgi:hypothetical protein
MYDYISPEKVLTALRWLKQNNPLYADIDINDDWLQQAVTNDEDLFGGLVEQCNTNNLNSDTDDMNTYSESVLPVQQPHSMECYPDSLSNDSNAFTIAFNVLEQVATENGFAIHDVPYDGDCLFSL